MKALKALLLKYPFAFIGACVLHLFMLLFFVSLNVKHKPKASLAQATIIQSVVLNEKDVMREVHKLQEKEQRQKREKAKLKRDLKKLKAQKAKETKALARAKREKLKERKRLNALKRDAKRLKAIKEQAKKEEANLKKLKAQKLKAENEILQLKKKRDLEAKAKALAQKKRVEEKLKALAKEKLISEGEKKRILTEVEKYAALIESAIKSHWIMPPNIDFRNKSLTVKFRLNEKGIIQMFVISHTSGNSILDRSAEIATFKAQPLPMPRDKAVLAKLTQTINLTLRP